MSFMRRVLLGTDEPVTGIVPNPQPRRFHLGSFMPPEFSHLEDRRQYPVFTDTAQFEGSPLRVGKGRSF